MKFEYKKIIVTGGAGFIGSHLTERLLKDGAKVIVIDDLTEGKWENIPPHKNLTKYEGSICEKNIGRLFKNAEVVFHLAALPRVQRSIKYPAWTHDVNVNGTLNLLLAARDHKVKRFIFSSTSSVYGEQAKLPFTEDMTPNPISPYGVHKWVCEEYCKLFSKLWGLGTVSLRYFNVYGPRMMPDGDYANLFPKFIKLMSHGKVPIINGDGNQTRDFTFVSDVVEANLLAAQLKITGEVFNIGSGKNISVNQVVTVLKKLLDSKIEPIHGPAVIEPKATLASIAKAKRILGWKPKVELADGLKTMVA
jgi:UDP-glucose 4-epimerase